eukprot:12118162-Alexandrium_andersonii.AAC.1
MSRRQLGRIETDLRPCCAVLGCARSAAPWRSHHPAPHRAGVSGHWPLLQCRAASRRELGRTVADCHLCRT